MKLNRLTPLCLFVAMLGGCTLHSPAPEAPVSTQSPSHPRFAPPPGGQSHWDSALGVYVLENAEHLYYRERTYYRWQEGAGWSWSSQPAGPWQATDASGVPAALFRHYAR